jgi:hypothetical protein
MCGPDPCGAGELDQKWDENWGLDPKLPAPLSCPLPCSSDTLKPQDGHWVLLLGTNEMLPHLVQLSTEVADEFVFVLLFWLLRAAFLLAFRSSSSCTFDPPKIQL